MKELLYIIKREYWTRARSKYFIYTSITGPLLISLLFIFPVIFENKSNMPNYNKLGIIEYGTSLKSELSKLTDIDIIDLRPDVLNNIELNLKTYNLDGIIEYKENKFHNIKYYCVNKPQSNLRYDLSTAINNLSIKKYLLHNEYVIPDNIFNEKSNINISIIRTQTSSINDIKKVIILIIGFVMLIFVHLFSSQVMRGVLEEKNNNIVEIIITTISPYKFMAGKIIGISLLGLTQILTWIIVLTLITSAVASFFYSGYEPFLNTMTSLKIEPEQLNAIINNIKYINIDNIFIWFTILFILGYFLYSSIYAVIGSVMSSTNEIQEVSSIVGLPLVVSFLSLTNLNGDLLYWCSFIPFTSPIALLGRIVNEDICYKEIVISVCLLLSSIGIVILLSGKIYKYSIVNRGMKISLSKILKRS